NHQELVAEPFNNPLRAVVNISGVPQEAGLNQGGAPARGEESCRRMASAMGYAVASDRQRQRRPAMIKGGVLERAREEAKRMEHTPAANKQRSTNARAL